MFTFLRKRDPQSRVAKDAAPGSQSGELASTRFAFRLFEAMKPGAKNVAVSPYGARLLLSLLSAGAQGQTRKEIAEVLGLDEKSQDSEKSYEARGLPFPHCPVKVEGGEDFLTASSLWCDTKFAVNSAFLEATEGDFRAEVREVPFGAASSVDEINKWVRAKTIGRLPTIVESLPNEVPLLALNAVYFKGLWLIPFEKGLTQEEDFKLLDGTTRKVPMMRQDGEMAYDERKGAQIVRVPYQGTMSMLIVLPPKKTPFGEFCASLRQTLATDWTRSRHRRPGSVRLPRFRIESDLDLSGALAGIGIRRAFERNVAEFGGISDAKPPLFLGRVRQKGFVEVNEKGTEAAAVTVAFIPLAAKHSVARRSFTMIVDRPFVFAICDNLTGAVVFLGTVVDPA